jgi:hypothetical protein
LYFNSRRDSLLPGITFVAFDLLVRGHLDQLSSFQPPRRSGIKSAFGLRLNLVSVASQLVKFDPTAGKRPETPAASFIAKISAVIDGPRENALARRFDRTHPMLTMGGELFGILGAHAMESSAQTRHSRGDKAAVRHRPTILREGVRHSGGAWPQLWTTGFSSVKEGRFLQD